MGLSFSRQRRQTCVREPVYRKNPLEKVQINNPKAVAANRTSLADPFLPFAVQSCTLLARLPFEIRMQIWIYTIGNRLFHIDLLPGRLGSRPCRGRPPNASFCNRAYVVEFGRPLACDYGIAERTGIIPFLQTCRQIYTEAIDVLYSHNTFDISELATMKYLIQGVPRQRICVIQNLHVHFHAALLHPQWPSPTMELGGTWELFWRLTFSELVKLRSIHIFINTHPTDVGDFETRKIYHGWSRRQELCDWDIRLQDTDDRHLAIEACKRRRAITRHSDLRG